MNEKFETLLKKKAEEMHFSADEKTQIKTRLHSFMRMNPVRNAELLRRNTQESKRNIIGNFAFFRLKYMPAIALALVVFLSGGMTYAAEGSLPGDLLYPVKINVSEPVRQYLTFSTESKAQLEADLAKERLTEAEELAVNGKLDSTVAADLDANFKTHADQASIYVHELNENGDVGAAANISTHLETSLAGHGKVLDTIVAANADAHNELKGIGESVNAQVNAAANVRSQIEAEAAQQLGTRAEATADAEIKLAENVIAAARAIFDTMKGSLSAETAAKAEARIKAAEVNIAEAKAKIDAKDYAGAFKLLQYSLHSAEGLKLLLTIQSHLKLNIDLGALGIGTSTKEELELDSSSATSSSESESHSTSTDAKGGIEITAPASSTDIDLKINTDTKASSGTVNTGSNTQINSGL